MLRRRGRGPALLSGIAVFRRSAVTVSALALVAAACTGGEKAATPPAALAARLQIALDRGLRAPGASAAIAVKGTIVWAATSGVADLETRKALTTRTRFPIAS